MGIQNILDRVYLICARTVNKVATIEKNDIFEIVNIDFLPFEVVKFTYFNYY